MSEEKQNMWRAESLVPNFGRYFFTPVYDTSLIPSEMHAASDLAVFMRIGIGFWWLLTKVSGLLGFWANMIFCTRPPFKLARDVEARKTGVTCIGSHTPKYNQTSVLTSRGKVLDRKFWKTRWRQTHLRALQKHLCFRKQIWDVFQLWTTPFSCVRSFWHAPCRCCSINKGSLPIKHCVECI